MMCWTGGVEVSLSLVKQPATETANLIDFVANPNPAHHNLNNQQLKLPSH
jgi:hypothetical protein